MPASSDPVTMYRFHHFPGIPNPYWKKAERKIAGFIKLNELKVAEIKHFIDLGIRGGIRVAHLHYKDQTILLNEEQWAKFSAGIIADSQALLAKTKKIGFEEALALGGLTQSL
jgi:hypothetical protein